jgi:hypothetical protein
VAQRQKQATTGHVIMQRNPVMRGWAQSHQHGSSKRTCAKVDHHTSTMLWQWARHAYRRGAVRRASLPCLSCANAAAYEDQGRGQSV